MYRYASVVGTKLFHNVAFGVAQLEILMLVHCFRIYFVLTSIMSIDNYSLLDMIIIGSVLIPLGPSGVPVCAVMGLKDKLIPAEFSLQFAADLGNPEPKNHFVYEGKSSGDVKLTNKVRITWILIWKILFLHIPL